ncbi:MAG TPA: DUF192 domain-containing protein [Candidatus Nanoarchaeia archaeon]|nr:DUF192 domain-containing protein [Candidatus Nanoarchaeia archaeon]
MGTYEILTIDGKEIHARVCTRWWEQALGYMCFSPLRKEAALLFVLQEERKISLHTFFCRNKLNIFFLDKNKKVMEKHENISSWRMIKPKQPCFFVLETRCY